jgi:hypothetical protein
LTLKKEKISLRKKPLVWKGVFTMKNQEELLAELDATLEQLIQNASLFCNSNFHVLEPVEIDSLYKTQESLVARFVHAQERLKDESKAKKCQRLQRKLLLLNELNETLMKKSFSLNSSRPRIGRNRKKVKTSLKLR